METPERLGWLLCITTPRAGVESFGRVPAMYYHLFFERIVQQMDIPICLVVTVADFQSVYTPKEIRICPPHCQPAGIVAEIPVEGIQ